MVQFVCSASSLHDAILTGAGRTLLGIAPSTRVVQADRLALDGDEMIFMFSDGLIEAVGRNDGRGMKRFFEMLKASSRRSASEVRDMILDMLAKGTPRGAKSDDVTFIVVKMNLNAAMRSRLSGGAKVLPLKTPESA